MDDILYQEMLSLQHTLVDGCPDCGGTGYLIPENPGEINPCRCMSVHTYICSLIEARLPRDYWWLSLGDLSLEDTYIDFVKWFTSRLTVAAANGMGVLYMGSNGIGKTSMQCIIGKEAVVQGLSVKYYTAQQYLEAKKSRNDNLLAEYESTQVILLDELDKVYISSGSDYVKRTLEDYLRRMTSEGRVMVICTNGDAEYLKSTFGDSTMSALARHLKFIAVKGEDYSKQLQDRWNTIMGEDRDWYEDSIVSMATRRTERMKAEDRDEWEKASRR